MNGPQRLTFDEFRHRLAQLLDLPEASLSRDTRLLEDLALDSIGLLELAARLEADAISLPDDTAWDVKTVGDMYELSGGPELHIGG
jgi:acyl carrier protein